MVECPYCENENEVNHDDGYGYEESETYEQRCKFCGKTFVYSTSIIYLHEAEKAPCKNEGEHKLKEIHGHPKEFFKYQRICEYCNERFIIDEKAHKQSLKDYHSSLNKRL